MPGPPPPPPPGAPPPPAFFAAPKSGGGADDRGALLKSIRQGTKLKKATTVDKSAPCIPGKLGDSNSNNSNSSSSSVSYGGHSPANGMGGLGGLFAGGMPKLRHTGKLGGSSSQVTSPVNNNNNDVRKFEAKNMHVIQNELKKQLASDSRNRGPPPPAPVRTISEDNVKPVYPPKFPTSPSEPSSYHHQHSYSQSSALQINHSTLHRKTKSNANLSHLDQPDNVNGYNQGPINKPVINHGKPNLAPKPPVLNGKPMSLPKKPLAMNGKPVSRAQSMKSPRSPSPQSPDGSSSPGLKYGTVRNMSSMLSQTLANSTGHLGPRNRPALNGRPTVPPPGVPPSLPGSPMIKGVKPPNHAPPPPPGPLPQPPNHPPPLPPHRTTVQQPVRAPPAVPSNNGGVMGSTAAAPPPPPRHSSMREATNARRIFLDLDEKFKDMFRSPDTFPKPPPFTNFIKEYSNRQVVNKQPAPQPPQIQPVRPWDPTTAC